MNHRIECGERARRTSAGIIEEYGMTCYPHYTDLAPADQAMCEPTQITRVILLSLGYWLAPAITARSHPTTKRTRVYHSQYIGVTVRRGRWVGQYGSRGRTTCKVFTSEPEDELRAAEWRAQALGLAKVEVRL